MDFNETCFCIQVRFSLESYRKWWNPLTAITQKRKTSTLLGCNDFYKGNAKPEKVVMQKMILESSLWHLQHTCQNVWAFCVGVTVLHCVLMVNISSMVHYLILSLGSRLWELSSFCLLVPSVNLWNHADFAAVKGPVTHQGQEM